MVLYLQKQTKRINFGLFLFLLLRVPIRAKPGLERVILLKPHIITINQINHPGFARMTSKIIGNYFSCLIY
jgi:hypothetical protein